jgi:hypothetical protein
MADFCAASSLKRIVLMSARGPFLSKLPKNAKKAITPTEATIVLREEIFTAPIGRNLQLVIFYAKSLWN